MGKKIYLFLFFFATFLSGQDGEKLIILHTTDVHGNIVPYNYFKDKPDNNGLAKVYTLVKEFRKKNKNVILLDSGDLIQGTPLVYYFDHIDRSLPNPLILVMNYMRYNAFTVGNHDIEQGYLTYYKAWHEADFPWLSANGIMEDGNTFFEPYTIIEKNGIKIGIVGLTTPGIPMWLDKSLYPGITWTDMVATARKYADLLRPQVDVLIGLFHAGMNADYNKETTDALGLPNANASRLVAGQVKGYDAIFCGHSHGRFPFKPEDNPLVNNTLMVLSGSHARYLGVAEFDLQKKSGDAWQVQDKTAYLLAMDTVRAAQEILAIAEPYHRKTLEYIRTKIGVTEDSLTARNARFYDSSLIELINKAQLAATGADISFAASFNERFVLPPGDILVKDVYGMYRYENFLYVVEMTGKQIKDFLEYCAGYFSWDDKRKTVGVNRKMAGYNYDMAEGIGYKIDVREKPGRRIKDLVFLKTGEPLAMEATYTVAMNSYRATGGGGHLAASGIKQVKVLWKSNEEMRNILLAYIREKKVIRAVANGNWRLVF